MNARPRHIKSIEANKEVTFNESIIITGDVEENSKITVYGDLTIEGSLNPGSNVTATGNIKVKQAFGPNTYLKSDGSIQVGLMTNDVRLITSNAYIGVKMPASFAAELNLRPALK